MSANSYTLGRRLLFAEPSTSSSVRLLVKLIELFFGVRCPRYAADGQWVQDGQVTAFWLIEEYDLVPLPGAPGCYVDLAVECPATVHRPTPAGLRLDLEDLSALDIILIEYLPPCSSSPGP